MEEKRRELEISRELEEKFREFEEKCSELEISRELE